MKFDYDKRGRVDRSLNTVSCKIALSDQFAAQNQTQSERTNIMALALVITLQNEIGEPMAIYAKAKTGKALARESERLSSAARKCNVPALSSMLSESQAALIAQLQEDGFDPAKMRIPPELWYSAAEGLKTVRGLFAQVTANLNDFKQPNPILRDLSAAEALLVAAEKAGVAFHFSNADL